QDVRAARGIVVEVDLPARRRVLDRLEAAHLIRHEIAEPVYDRERLAIDFTRALLSRPGHLADAIGSALPPPVRQLQRHDTYPVAGLLCQRRVLCSRRREAGKKFATPTVTEEFLHEPRRNGDLIPFLQSSTEDVSTRGDDQPRRKAYRWTLSRLAS